MAKKTAAAAATSSVTPATDAPKVKRNRASGVDRIIKGMGAALKHATAYQKLIDKWADKVGSGAHASTLADAKTDIGSVVECSTGLLASCKTLKDAGFSAPAPRRAAPTGAIAVGSAVKLVAAAATIYPNIGDATTEGKITAQGPVRGTVLVDFEGTIALVAKQHLEAAVEAAA
jgi:hypothetical protein